MIPKCCCMLCHSELAINMLDRHYNTKQCQSGSKFSNNKLKNCPHCDIDVTSLQDVANHVKFCLSNPKRNQYISAKQLNTKEAREKAVLGIKDAHKAGAYDDAPKKAIQTKIERGNLTHTPESIEKIRQHALSSKHQRRMKHTHDFIDKLGRKFKFDSSWEDALAIRLDELNIQWDRPEPVLYVGKDGRVHKYYADFYLPEFDLYIDPKNTYVQKLQAFKLNALKGVIKLIILNSLQECLNFNIPHYTS